MYVFYFKLITNYCCISDNAGMTDDMEPNHGHDESYSDNRYR